MHLAPFISAAVGMLCKQHLQPVVTGRATWCLDKAREGQGGHPDKKTCLGNHSICVDIASSGKGEDLMRSLDQLLRSAAEHQMVAVRVDSSTVGKARRRESGREVM